MSDLIAWATLASSTAAAGILAWDHWKSRPSHHWDIRLCVRRDADADPGHLEIELSLENNRKQTVHLSLAYLRIGDDCINLTSKEPVSRGVWRELNPLTSVQPGTTETGAVQVPMDVFDGSKAELHLTVRSHGQRGSGWSKPFDVSPDQVTAAQVRRATPIGLV